MQWRHRSWVFSKCLRRVRQLMRLSAGTALPAMGEYDAGASAYDDPEPCGPSGVGRSRQRGAAQVELYKREGPNCRAEDWRRHLH